LAYPKVFGAFDAFVVDATAARLSASYSLRAGEISGSADTLLMKAASRFFITAGGGGGGSGRATCAEDVSRQRAIFRPNSSLGMMFGYVDRLSMKYERVWYGMRVDMIL